MQQAPQTPAPPAAPPPATTVGVPTVTVTLPDGPIPVNLLPRTAEQVHGLRERREMLRDQLARATNRREELVAELNQTGAAEARAGILQRLALVDERILQLERDQASTERLLSNAAPEVVALAGLQREHPNDGDDAAAFMFLGIGFGIALALLIGWFRRMRARRRGKKTGALTPVSADRRLDELTSAVHAIAEEVERIGEGQRFVTQLLAQRQTVALKNEPERR